MVVKLAKFYLEPAAVRVFLCPFTGIGVSVGGAMLEHPKNELAASASYAASAIGAGIGTWMAEHWLQLASLLFMALTYATNVYYKRRKDRRELQRHELHLDKITDKLDEIS